MTKHFLGLLGCNCSWFQNNLNQRLMIDFEVIIPSAAIGHAQVKKVAELSTGHHLGNEIHGLPGELGKTQMQNGGELGTF